jgi:hypothetical protein
MQIEIFTICDNAQVYAGKAVVMGAFNQVKVQKLPVVVPNLTLAVRVAFDKEEEGDKSFYFFIKNPDGSSLVPELRCDTKQVPRQNTQDQLITYDMNIVLGNVVFNQYGCYTVTMKYLNKDFYLKFYVQKTG